MQPAPVSPDEFRSGSTSRRSSGSWPAYGFMCSRLVGTAPAAAPPAHPCARDGAEAVSPRPAQAQVLLCPGRGGHQTERPRDLVSSTLRHRTSDRQGLQ
jgi:hypothetical protein